jgi:hypothetical protein
MPRVLTRDPKSLGKTAREAISHGYFRRSQVPSGIKDYFGTSQRDQYGKLEPEALWHGEAGRDSGHYKP